MFRYKMDNSPYITFIFSSENTLVVIFFWETYMERCFKLCYTVWSVEND